MLISLSANPDWWVNLSLKEQERYLETHPRSKLKVTAKRKQPRQSKPKPKPAPGSKPMNTRIKRKYKIAPQPKVGSTEEDIRTRLDSSLSKSDKIKLDNALELAAKKNLGKPLTQADIESVAKRTVNPAIAARIFGEVSGAAEKDTFKTLMHTAIGMSAMALGAAGLVSAAAITGSVLPLVIGAYFVNRIIEDPSSTIAKLNQIELPVVDKMSKMFSSFWSTLDIDMIKRLTDTNRSESAASRITFRSDKRKNVLDDSESVNYVVCKSGKPCGMIRWDKACGPHSDRVPGWVVTLFDGFNESAHRSGRGENANEPFTAVHKGEVKLQNPTRLSLDLARSWARSVLR